MCNRVCNTHGSTDNGPGIFIKQPNWESQLNKNHVISSKQRVTVKGNLLSDAEGCFARWMLGVLSVTGTMTNLIIGIFA